MLPIIQSVFIPVFIQTGILLKSWLQNNVNLKNDNPIKSANNLQESRDIIH